MIIWIDAQLPSGIAVWLIKNFEVDAKSLSYMGLQKALDKEIFFKARENNAVLMSKDSDILDLLDQYGPPPKVIWLTCGNTSNEKLKEILSKSLKQAIVLLEAGESLVEIADETF